MKWFLLTRRAVARSPLRIVTTGVMALAYVAVVIDAVLPGGGVLGAIRLWVGLGFTIFIVIVLAAWVREEEAKTRDDSQQR